MDSDQIQKVTGNIFQLMAPNLQNFRNLMQQKCVFNNLEDPWKFDQQKLVLENPDKPGTPMWIVKFGQEYGCIQRLLLNASWKNYNDLGKPEQLRYLCIGYGYAVDFQNLVQFQLNDRQKQRQIFFGDGTPQRPVIQQRFNDNPNIIFKDNNDQQNISLSQQISSQNQNSDIKFQMNKHNFLSQKFQIVNHGFLSQKQIFEGVIQECFTQMKLVQNYKKETDEQLLEGFKIHKQAWAYIFKSLGLDIESDQQINVEYVNNYKNRFSKSILFIYSLETFLYKTLNKSSRDYDESKVSSLGPFAYALDMVLQNAEKYREDSQIEDIEQVYRGLQLPKDIVDQFIQLKNKDIKVQLGGFQSTSQNYIEALKFMFDGPPRPSTMEPVLLEIEIYPYEFGFAECFSLDTQELSMFPYEKEILLQDGKDYKIQEVLENKDYNGLLYTHIKLEYNPA